MSGSSSHVQLSYSSAEPNHMWPIHHNLFPSSDLIAMLDARYTSGVHSVTNLTFLYGVLPIPGYGCYRLMIQCKMLEILTEACGRRIRFNARNINPVIRVNAYMWSEMSGNQIWCGREQCRLHQFVDAMHNSFPLFCNSQKSTITAYNKVALSGKWSIKIIPAARHKPRLYHRSQNMGLRKCAT